MPGALIVRRALPTDARDIWLWRNDACTRAMSVSPEEVAWGAHTAWFEASLDDRSRSLYVGCLGDGSRKVGICRFDLDPGTGLAEASINLDPAMRGLNLSRRLLAAGIRLCAPGMARSAMTALVVSLWWRDGRLGGGSPLRALVTGTVSRTARASSRDGV